MITLLSNHRKKATYWTRYWHGNANTYRGLFLPHFDVLPLSLCEVIPDLLVAGRSKDAFNLTDCW